MELSRRLSKLLHERLLCVPHTANNQMSYFLLLFALWFALHSGNGTDQTKHFLNSNYLQTIKSLWFRSYLYTEREAIHRNCSKNMEPYMGVSAL